MTDLPRALVDSWGLAAGRDGGDGPVEVARAAVITALRERRVRPDALIAEAHRRPALPGRGELHRLVELVRSGSHSELEIWGLRHVFQARDTRRDVALAARGWVVLRFSYRRLTTDPEGCRREIRQVVAARRALLVQR